MSPVQHNLLGMDTTQFDNYVVNATLKGFRRMLGDKLHRKLPLTIDMLTKLISSLDVNSGLKAIVLTGFFTFARRSNLVPPSESQFDTEKHLCRGSISFTDGGAIIKISWSKTIQFNERTLYLPMFTLADGHPPVPIAALKQHWRIFIWQE